MLKINFILFCFALFPYFILAQIQIKGKIIDNAQNNIQYASVGYYNNNVGVLSDSDGYFSISKIVGDSIKVSMIGFISQTIVIKTSTDSLIVQLQKYYSDLLPVTISKKLSKKYKTSIGFYEYSNTFKNLLAVNLQEATFIPNTKHISGFIKEIKFKLQDFRNKHFCLRIRLFNINPNNGLPDKDLLLSDNLIYPNELRHKNSFSILNKYIQLPFDGVFVSFEWLPINNNYKSEKVPYLVGNSNINTNYRYQNFKEIKWHPAILGLTPGSYEVVNVSIVIVN